MKRNFLLLLAILWGMNLKAQTVEDANILFGNLSSNFYYDSYDDNTKTINGFHFSVLVDGTNSDFITPSFSVKVYLWDGSNPNFVKTFTGLTPHHFSSTDFIENIDLSGVSLPAGSYDVGLFVDAEDDIPNPPDNPNDNAGIISGNPISFTPVTGLEAILPSDLGLPNPVSSAHLVDLLNNHPDVISYEVIDLLGNKLGEGGNGMYILKVETVRGISSGKIVISE